MPWVGQPPHEHNSDETFDQLLEQARNSARSVTTTGGPLSDKQLVDNYLVAEQKDRSRVISSILRNYEKSYKNKVVFQQRYRKILFWGCSGIVILFVVTTLFLMCYVIRHVASLDVSGTVAVITAMLSFVGTILGLVHTITKYCFPENDEEYIVKIVESIQNNDLESTKENNRATEVRSTQKNPTQK